jgi:cation:H+ antiporter
MDVITLVWLVAGLALLAAGAELLVRGAARIATLVGVSPLVIGLTVVACGTSAPELAVSAHAAMTGSADIALGNVVGSNILNVLFILGICALVRPLVVAQQLVRIDVPIMIGASLLVWLFAADGRLGLGEGATLTGLFVVYTVWAILKSRGETAAVQEEYANAYGPPSPRPTGAASFVGPLALVLVGLVSLVVGARWLVAAAVVLARTLGVSDLVIGLTVIAAGTSLPEVATSIVATIRGQRDIAIGNVVGSNLCNLLLILGVSSLLAAGSLSVAPSVVAFDLPVMIAVAVACLPIFFTGYAIHRWEGALLLGYYIAFTLFLVLRSTHHDSLRLFSTVMVAFVVPLTAVTLAVLTVRALRAPSNALGRSANPPSTP